VTRVYVDVVGDLFHPGHVAFLQKAAELGDTLVVGVHPDDEVTDYKREPVLTMDERVALVRACRYADEVIENAPLRVSTEFLERHRIDLVVHGDDISDANRDSMYGDAVALGIFRTIPYTDGISTTAIIERIRRRLDADELDAVRRGA
jgi:glycerol-3-phosphate cytidylyltransferase